MGRGVHLGSIAGIQVFLDWSLLIIFALVAVGLGGGLFPAWHPDWGAGLVWLVALAAAALLIVSVLVHELSHALVGRAQGLRIPRITLFVFGGAAHLEREPHAWRAELWMAIVGPLASIAIGASCLFLAGAVIGPVAVDPDDPMRALAAVGPLGTILLWLGPINILLGLFNLVPGFPLDGGRVLRAILWGATGDVYRATRWAAGLGRAFGWLLIACGVLMILGFRLPVLGGGPLGGVWIALIGWFLNNAAIMSYRQLLVQRSLESVPVSRVMLSSFVTVDPLTTVAELVDDYMIRSDQRSFPVLRDGRLVGVVSLADVRAVEPGARAARVVADIMTPVERLPTVTPQDAATEALHALSQRAIDQVPVVKNGEVRGIVRREDIARWLALHDAREAPA